MAKFIPSLESTGRALAVFLLTGAALHAQAPVSAVQTPSSALAVPAIETSHDDLFSSSSAQSEDGTTTMASLHAPAVNFGEAFQYGGGRRSGRPRYRGSNTNADGSAKYTFVVGGGFGQPVGNTYHYNTPSYGLQVGGGRQFNKNFATLLQFDYDNFGLTSGTLNNQQNLYNYYVNLYNQTPQGIANPASAVSGLDGNAHVWSFTLNPTYTIYSGEGLGAYVVAGVGFYHKVTDFTVPAQGVGYDPYYGYYTYTANQTIDHYTSNAPGFNGGFGLTYKFSRFSNQRLFGEVRYVFVDNQHRNGVTVATASAANANVANEYPANSNRTSYFPVKFGLRF